MALLCLFDPALGQLQHLTGKDIREFVVEFLKSVGSERLTRFVMAGLAGGLSRGTSGYVSIMVILICGMLEVWLLICLIFLENRFGIVWCLCAYFWKGGIVAVFE